MKLCVMFVVIKGLPRDTFVGLCEFFLIIILLQWFIMLVMMTFFSTTSRQSSQNVTHTLNLHLTFKGELNQSPYRRVTRLGSHLGNNAAQLCRANKIRLLSK